jgi:hypothetical protein
VIHIFFMLRTPFVSLGEEPSSEQHPFIVFETLPFLRSCGHTAMETQCRTVVINPLP